MALLEKFDTDIHTEDYQMSRAFNGRIELTTVIPQTSVFLHYNVIFAITCKWKSLVSLRDLSNNALRRK